MKPHWRAWREDAGGVGVIALMAAASWLLVVEPGADARQQALGLRTQTDLVQSQVAMVQAQSRTAEGDLAAASAQAGPARPLRHPTEFNGLLASLNRAALESGLALDQIRPGAVDRTLETSKHRITLAGRGTYPAAVAYLLAIRDQFPDVTVVALSARHGGEADDHAALLSLELAWHAQPDPKPTRNAN